MLPTIWSHYFKGIEKLEKIQRRVTKIISKLRNKPYEERLRDLNLYPQTKRRLRGDLTAVFKIFKGFFHANPDAYFTVYRSNITKNNGYKINGERFKTEETKYYLFDRVVNIWNRLPSNVINSDTVETFNHLGNYLFSNPYWHCSFQTN